MMNSEKLLRNMSNGSLRVMDAEFMLAVVELTTENDEEVKQVLAGMVGEMAQEIARLRELVEAKH